MYSLKYYKNKSTLKFIIIKIALKIRAAWINVGIAGFRKILYKWMHLQSMLNKINSQTWIIHW